MNILQIASIKKIPFSHQLTSYLPYIPGGILFAYILVRAIILPITHDEYATVLYYSKMELWDILTYKDPIPNNHILNTLLIKVFSGILGYSPWVVRLPNILAFILYYAAVVAIMKKVIPNVWGICFGVAIMVFNPFLLDFFSLARGYALSITFMVVAIYFSLTFLEHQNRKNLLISLVFAAAGVYTNFTILNFYAAFVGLFCLLILLQHATLTYEEIIKRLFIVVSVSVILAMFSYIPITKMIGTNQFVYWGTNGFYKDTVESLMICSIYDSNHFDIPVIVLVLPFAIVFLFSFLLVLPTFFKKWKITFNKPYQLFFLIFIGSVIVNILQHKIAGTPYLVSRTALLFYPLFALTFIGAAQYLFEKKSRIFYPFIILIISLSTYHVIRKVNLKFCYEWWYDANTYEVLEYLEAEQKKTSDKPLTLNTSWWFFPSFDYNVQTRNLKWINLSPYHKEPQPDGQYEYYYATGDDIPSLEKNYVVVKSFGWNTRFLLKKK